MHQAWFRFYEELNDFLPDIRRKTSFGYSFKGNPAVKDAIEAIGVPHVEVDMIVVNGIPVDFYYKIRSGDQISVYPVFESFDISNVSPLRAKPLRVTRFITDVHLGKLSRYLRLCGFDTIFETGLSDREIVDISVTGKRIILTRDRNLLKNKRVTHGYWIRSNNPFEQLEEVLIRFDLRNDLHPFSRCMECNGLIRKVPKEDVIDELLPGTRNCYTDFKKCDGCGRIYWEGSHFDRMKKLIATISDL
jgi:uncharacterized protein with PIN domain